MASGEAAEPLQYTTTVLRVSIHCEGCKKKVKKVLHGIEGVYKVTIDATQHRVTVTGSVAADALVRRLLKSGKQASLWPVPAPAAAEGKKGKPEEVVAAAETGKGADKTDKKPKKVAEETEPESSEKKPEKGKSSEKKPEEDKVSEKKAEAKKPKDEAKEKEVPEKKEKGSPEPAAKEANAEEAGGEKTGGKKGKKKNKQKDAGGDGDAAAEKPPQQQQQQPKTKPQPQLQQPMTPGPDRAHAGGFSPYYAPQPVMSYNMAQPSASVSYYAPTPAVSMQPMPLPPPPHMPYGYSPYPPTMMMPPPEFMYGPPGMRSSPPRESYNNMFNEENPSSCSLM